MKNKNEACVALTHALEDVLCIAEDTLPLSAEECAAVLRMVVHELYPEVKS